MLYEVITGPSAEPLGFQSPAQAHPRVVQDHSEIGLGDVQCHTDLLGGLALDLDVLQGAQHLSLVFFVV